MKWFSGTIALAVLTVAPATAFAQKVNTDFDPSAGFTKAAGNPDVFIATHAMGKEEKEIITTGFDYGYGYYRWGGAMGGGMTTSTVNSYTVGTLILDMYDGSTKKLVWRGTGSDTLSDKAEKNAKKVDKALQKMFKEYPPAPPKSKP